MRGYLTRMVSLTTLLIAIMPPAPWAQSQEAVAVITELKLNRGDIQIRLPGKMAPEGREQGREQGRRSETSVMTKKTSAPTRS